MGVCRRFFVSGRVQGVAYRAWTRDQAFELGLTGWAANLPDGRVEVVACGNLDAVSRLAERLRRGPPSARVASVEETAVDIEAPSGFATR
jgi:acylphosphatase